MSIINFQEESNSCSYQCYNAVENEQSPIEDLIDWFTKKGINQIDSQSSICMLDMALKYNL